MRGKVCIVTGATAGIGLATALGLAKREATLILVGRSPERGAAAVQRIRAEAGGALVEFMPADLSAQAEVRRLARELRKRHSRLDVLINNAGGFFHRRRESIDGIEMTWALNVLAPYLLTNLLLPALESDGPSRIINLTSFTQQIGRIRFDDPEGRRRYCRVQAYAQSKQAVLLLTAELARRLEGRGVTVNAVDPGLVATGIISENAGRQWKPIQDLLNLLGRTPRQGAEVILYLATSPEVEGVSGRCFRNPSVAGSRVACHDEAVARRLWEVCAEMTEAARPASDGC